MLSGPPHPLSSECPVAELLPLIRGRRQVGAWVRSARRRLHLHIHRYEQRYSLLLGPDLGFLLRRCNWVAVTVEERPLLAPAEDLIRCRALQVVTGTPYLPSAQHLRSIFPGLDLDHAGFWVPIQSSTPEEVLSVCLTWRIPVMESRIGYSW